MDPTFGITGYVALVALLYLTQRSLLYFPDTRRMPPTEAGLRQAEEAMLQSSDGVRVSAWHVPPRENMPVVIYFQGNGGGLDLRAERFKKLTADGTGLVALNYRGYGGSEGNQARRGSSLMPRRPMTSPRNAMAQPHRALGRVARDRGGGRFGGGKAGGSRHFGVALQLGRRRRRLGLLVRAGAVIAER